MKKLTLALSIIATSFIASAQSNEGAFHFAGGLHVGLPVGSFGDSHSFGIGAELQGEYNFAETLSGTITTGYTSFFGKEVSIPGFGTYKYESVGYVPILAGVRVYAAPAFFIGGKIGYGIFTGTGNPSGFNYRPEIGYNGERFQLAVGYNGVSVTGGTLGHIGLSALYKFN